MIELRHLRYFVAVAEELSFRKAAERVHIDQTPLSRAVRDLEERMGVTLFVRTQRRLQLTPAGAKLLEHARAIFIRLERTMRVVRETDARHREPLRVGVDDSTAQPKLAEWLSRWREVAPDIPVNLTEMCPAELLAALRSEEVDAGFSFGVPDDETIARQVAWVSPIVALLPAAHELACREVVSLAELLSFPAIACNAAYHPGLCQQMEAIFRRYSLAPTIAGEARTLTGYLTRVAAGQGVGMADADHMRALRRTDVVIVPLAEPVHITTYVLHKNQPNGLSESLQRFLAHATVLH
ncbi:LysR family transcriptional regulator [Variovorax paradoxus]|uniref:LysR family transcriptional regulator n=1 Tax=Variovorax paradoxus TaxID=34073 RepID=A0A5Q0M9U1_VARPD|nr:LysR substrate-binding domain-containing protein [Variovorax paradoxus]QFZ85192.1 LysR family transcriptional regulator [Variovorax paradoxus]